MLRLVHACAAALALGLLSTTSLGVQVAVKFHGTVGAAFDAPFGRSILLEAPVTGRFVFETVSAASHSTPGCDCTGYVQHIVNGFAADLGGIAIRADEYLVEISNDIEYGPGEAYDFFTVRWESGLTPALASPLLIDGTAYSAGLFSVSLNAFPELFASSALPTGLSPVDFVFPAEFNPLGDYDPVPGNVDVLFDVASAEPTQFFRGDFDFNEAVDGADLLDWQRRHFDAAGLAAWNGTFGLADSPTVDSRAAPTPEPHALILCSAALVAVHRQGRRGARLSSNIWR